MEINMRGLCPLIQVFDMDNSLRFYCDLLGFEIVGKGGSWRLGLAASRHC
jgi:hypothetical protein